uniref:H15 domain-containing protein n=1 Tax=Nelumbo nucifera TaxID=4432 RepID=A0A822ZED8_NELNU|nr:TPA_asm: hypothetical protein HUJ06_014291 [Nelumbo nucifera]
MTKEALLALHEKSTRLKNCVEEKHKAVLSANLRKILTLQLKNCVAKGKLIKIKASFKLSESSKKEKVVKGAKAATVKKPKKPKAASAALKAKSVKKSDTTPERPPSPRRRLMSRRERRQVRRS